MQLAYGKLSWCGTMSWNLGWWNAGSNLCFSSIGPCIVCVPWLPRDILPLTKTYCWSLSPHSHPSGSVSTSCLIPAAHSASPQLPTVIQLNGSSTVEGKALLQLSTAVFFPPCSSSVSHHPKESVSCNRGSVNVATSSFPHTEKSQTPTQAFI